jgi:hypothetical protein
MSPLSYKPKLTPSDITRGFITRYFAQNISTKKITEINRTQYEQFKFDSLYSVFTIQWIISGLANDTISKDGKTLYGVRHNNTTTTNFYNNKYSGLNRILRNPLEYFIGVDNKTQ